MWNEMRRDTPRSLGLKALQRCRHRRPTQEARRGHHSPVMKIRALQARGLDCLVDGRQTGHGLLIGVLEKRGGQRFVAQRTGIASQFRQRLQPSTHKGVRCQIAAHRAGSRRGMVRCWLQTTRILSLTSPSLEYSAAPGRSRWAGARTPPERQSANGGTPITPPCQREMMRTPRTRPRNRFAQPRKRRASPSFVHFLMLLSAGIPLHIWRSLSSFLHFASGFGKLEKVSCGFRNRESSSFVNATLFSRWRLSGQNRAATVRERLELPKPRSLTVAARSAPPSPSTPCLTGFSR